VRRPQRLFAERLATGDHEHHVVGHQAEHRVDVAGLACRHPGRDQLANGAFVIGHGGLILLH
jgi:hypothetical protein